MPRQYWQLGLLNDRVLKLETIGPPFDLVYIGAKDLGCQSHNSKSSLLDKFVSFFNSTAKQFCVQQHAIG